jgi:hypothetical protein
MNKAAPDSSSLGPVGAEIRDDWNKGCRPITDRLSDNREVAALERLADLEIAQ